MNKKSDSEWQFDECKRKKFHTSEEAGDYGKAHLPPGFRFTIKEIQPINNTGKNLRRPYYVIGEPGLDE
jgi:hypothetical protein